MQPLRRVIRRKVDGRAGKFVFFYAIGTIEYPEISGDIYLNEVLPHARYLGWFTLPEDIADLLEFLKNPAPAGEIPQPTGGRHEKRALQPATPPTPWRERSETHGTSGSGQQRIGPPAPAEPDQVPPERDVEWEVEPEEWDGEIPELLRGIAVLGKDSTDQYLKQISRYPLLTAEEEVRLGQAIEAGLFAYEKVNSGVSMPRREKRELRDIIVEGRKAHQRFLCASLRLVVSIAKKYFHSAGTLDLLDLIQEGNLGLERALQKWDFARGLKFYTYASWWVSQSVTRALAESSRTIRVPVHKVEDIIKMNKLLRDLKVTMTRNEALIVLAEEHRTSVKALTELFDLDRPLKSLDQLSWVIDPGRVELMTFGDRILDEFQDEVESNLVLEMRTHEVDNLLASLTEKEEFVMRLRYGLAVQCQPEFVARPRTLDEIGAQLNVTRERIRQIEKKARSQLENRVRKGYISREALTL